MKKHSAVSAESQCVKQKGARSNCFAATAAKAQTCSGLRACFIRQRRHAAFFVSAGQLLQSDDPTASWMAVHRRIHRRSQNWNQGFTGRFSATPRNVQGRARGFGHYKIHLPLCSEHRYPVRNDPGIEISRHRCFLRGAEYPRHFL